MDDDPGDCCTCSRCEVEYWVTRFTEILNSMVETLYPLVADLELDESA